MAVISCGRGSPRRLRRPAYPWVVRGHGGRPQRRAAVRPEHGHDGRTSQERPRGRILVVMKPARAASRRFLPTSPFGPPAAAPPPEQFAVRDQVVHDTYGLGRVIGVEADIALAVDFGSCRVRIVMPCAKLTRL